MDTPPSSPSPSGPLPAAPTQVTTVAAADQASRPPATLPTPPQPPSLRVWRWLARAFLSLWWVFVAALAADIASSLGTHAGPTFLPLLPQVVDWARTQSRFVQGGMAVAALILLALMAWLTYLAWRHRQQQAVEEVEADITRQTAAFQGALDRDVHPRLDGLQMRTAEVARERAEFEKALRLARELGDKAAILQGLLGLAVLDAESGETARARNEYEEALWLARELGAPSAVGRTLLNLGNLARQQGQLEEARQRYEQAQAVFQEVGDRGHYANTLSSLGNLALEQGQLEEAERYLQQALAIDREVWDRWSEGVVLANLGQIALAVGQLEQARAYFEQSLAIAREVGHRRGEGMALFNLYRLAQQAGPSEDAERYFQQSAIIAQELGLPPDEWVSASRLGHTAAPGDQASSNTGSGKEPVHFTAYYPLLVVPERAYSLVVYTHVPEASAHVRLDVQRFRDQMPGPVNEASVAATQQVMRKTRITIVPECEGVFFYPEEMSFKWFEDMQRSEFRFVVESAHLGRSLKGEIAVFAGPLQIAALDFTVLCKSQDEIDAMAGGSAEVTGKLYERVFASYSHKDSEIAMACRNAYRALGMTVDIDFDALRSGDDFAPRLKEFIQHADVFQLFWSHNSAQSDWVRREWEYALELKRETGFIRPVYWERPEPPRPSQLNHVHFKYMPLARLVGAEDDPYSHTATPQSAVESESPLATVHADVSADTHPDVQTPHPGSSLPIASGTEVGSTNPIASEHVPTAPTPPRTKKRFWQRWQRTSRQ